MRRSNFLDLRSSENAEKQESSLLSEIYQQIISETLGQIFGPKSTVIPAAISVFSRGKAMSSQYIQTTETQHIPIKTYSSEAKLLHEKIENLTSLVNSLNAAVEDLESIEVPALDENFDFYSEVERFESNLIRSALRLTGGSQVKAAKLLKLNATTLNAKIKTLHLAMK